MCPLECVCGINIRKKEPAATSLGPYGDSPDAILHCSIRVKLKYTIFHSYIMQKSILAIHKVAVRDPQLFMHAIVQGQVQVGLMVC